MGNPEKTIEIKNAEDTEIKDKLSENKAPRLTDDNETYFRAALNQQLKPAGVNIFDTAKSELIRQGNTLVIAQRNLDSTLTPKLVIDGGDREKTYKLTIDFIKYLTNVPLRMIYQETSVDIEKNKEITNVVASTNKEVTDIYKEIPTKERIKELIGAVNDQYQEELASLSAFRKDSIIGGFKLKMDEQQVNNVEILKKMIQGHAEDLHLINERFYRITGIDTINKKSNPDIKNDLRNPMYKETFIKYNTSLLYMSKQFNKIMLLTNDPDFIRGKYKLSDTDIIDYGLYGRDEIASFVKNLEKNNAIDKERVEEMMKVAMVQLENEDYKALFNYLKGVSEKTIDPTKEPFVAQNVEKVEELVKMYPFLKDYIKLNIQKEYNKDAWKHDPTSYNPENEGNTGGGAGSTTTEGGTTTAAGGTSAEVAPDNTTYTNGRDAAGKGGVYGVVDYYTKPLQGKSEKTQQFYHGFGNALLTIGGAVLGRKVLRNAFRLVFGKKEDIDKNHSRARVLGGAGLMLATGGRPGEIFRGGESTQNLATMLGGLRGSKKNNPKETNPIVDKVDKNASESTKELYGISKVTALFEGRNLEQMRLFVEEDGGKMKLNTEDLKNNIKTLQALSSTSVADQKKFETQLEVLESLGKDKGNLIDIGLNSLGITYDQIKNGDKKTLFTDLAVDPLARIGSVGPYMEKEKFTEVAVDDPAKKALLESFIKTGKPTLDELKNQGVFLTETTPPLATFDGTTGVLSLGGEKFTVTAKIKINGIWKVVDATGFTPAMINKNNEDLKKLETTPVGQTYTLADGADKQLLLTRTA